MKFNADRLSQLAGLPARKGNLLSEAGNRSLHDDASVSDESDFRHGKGQLAEKWGDSKGDKIGPDEGAGWGEKPGDKAYVNERDPLAQYEGDDDPQKDDDGDGEVLEIDERMLAQEIRRMRKERLQENELRKAIRGEIRSVLKNLKGSRKSSTSGQSRQRRRSTQGVTGGFLGPGFHR